MSSVHIDSQNALEPLPGSFRVRSIIRVDQRALPGRFCKPSGYLRVKRPGTKTPSIFEKFTRYPEPGA